MKKINFFESILVLLMICSSGLSQTENIGTSQPQFKDLKLQIISPRASLLPLEPVPLIIKLTNTTNQSILGHISIGFSSHKIHIFVRIDVGPQS